MELGYFLLKNRPDDQYIVAHPRSGSTWLRTILVNILAPDANSNPDVFNKKIPGVTFRRIWHLYRMSSPRILMSHTMYRNGLARVVYLIRDGRDALVSFYHYTITRRNLAEKVNFEEFFDTYLKGYYGYLWHRDVQSWLVQGRSMLDDNLKVIHFEQLKSNPIQTAIDVTSFLGISATRESIQSAVEKAEIENLRGIELQRWRKAGLGIPEKNQSFYRSGKPLQWREYFSPSIEKKFHSAAAETMHLAGYDIQ